MITGLTDKLGLAPAVRFLTVTASRAGARGVARVYRDNSHACHRRFVFNKAPELSESPVRLFCALALSNRGPRAYAFQFFKGDRSVRVLSLQNNLFRDAVIFVGLIAPLPAAHPAQFTVSGASTDLLYRRSALTISPALVLYALTRVALAVAVGGDLRYAEVNPDSGLDLVGRRFQYLADGQQEKVAPVVNQIAFALSRFKQLPLTLTADVRNLLAALNRPDGHELFFCAPGQNPVVEREGGKRLELAKGFRVELVGVGHFRNRSHDNLSRQTELPADPGIGEFVQAELLECLIFPGDLTDSVTGGIGTLKRLTQRPGLLFCGVEFHLRDQLHDSMIARIFHNGNIPILRREEETGICNRTARH
jgi:hypothetical protein